MLKNGILALAAGVSFLVLSGAPASAQSGTIMFAVLQGENEVPNPPPGAEGIHGAASVVFKSSTRLCFSLVINGAAGTPTAAHIHRGFGSETGPIVVDFVAPASGNPGTRSGCVTTTAAISNEIRGNRYGFYVNVHTSIKPAGALRGQLF